MWLTSSSGLGSLYDFYIKPIGKHHIEPPAKQNHYPGCNIKIIWTIKELLVDLSKYFPTPPLTYRPIIPTDSSSRHLQAFSKVDTMPTIVGPQFISSAASSGTLSDHAHALVSHRSNKNEVTNACSLLSFTSLILEGVGKNMGIRMPQM
ncbi:hypothetical protein WN943_029143 [Citrus x changshan-huyou]